MHVLRDGSGHVHERAVTGRGRHVGRGHLTRDIRPPLLLGTPAVGGGQTVGPAGRRDGGLGGHVRLVSAGVGHDDHRIASLILVRVASIEFDGLRAFERQDVLVNELPGLGRIGVRISGDGGASQALGTLKERGLAVGDVIAGLAAFLVLGQAIVHIADLEHGGINAGVLGILPLLGRSERLEVAGGGHHKDVVCAVGLRALHCGGTGVIGVFTRGPEHHIGVQRVIPESFRRPSHAHVVGVDLDTGVAVLGVGASPVHHIGGLPCFKLQRAILLVLAPALRGDLEVGGDHVELVAILGLEHIRVTQALGIGVGDDNRVAAVNLAEREEVVAVGGGLVQRLTDLAVGGGLIGKEGHGRISAVRNGAGLLLDSDFHGLGHDLATVVGGCGGQCDRLGITVAVSRASHHAGTLIRIGHTVLRSLVLGVSAGNELFIRGLPRNRRTILGAFGN